MLGNTFREYLARKRPFCRPSPSENTFERYLAMILGCLCVQECPFLPMPHLVSCSGTHRKWDAVRNDAVRNDAVRNDVGHLSVANALRSRPLCRLKRARGSGMQVPGVLLAACQTMSVKHVGSRRVGALVGAVDAGLLGGGWLRVCRGACVAVGKAQLSRGWLRVCWGARVTPPPYSRPQVCQISFGHVPLARARASVHEAIRPFRPWPCEPFP